MPRRNQAFDFTAAVRAVCQDMTERLPDLGHIRLDRVAIGVRTARRRTPYGVFATLTPLRFEAGRLHETRRGQRWRIAPLVDFKGRDFLYLLSFYLPRFVDLPLEAKLSTIVHELWHIGPQFDGDLRRHAGRCYAHGGSQRAYDAAMDRLAQRWLAADPPTHLYDFLASDYDNLAAEHGAVRGQALAHAAARARVKQPLARPVRIDASASDAYRGRPSSASVQRWRCCSMIHAAATSARRRKPTAWLLVNACAVLGCQAAFTAPPDRALEKLLRPVTTSPQSVMLEVWDARIPLDEDRQAEAIWQQVDEQCFDADLRRQMLANGLRAGVIGGTLPEELSKLLGLASEMPQESGERVVTPALAAPSAKLRVVQVNRQEERTIQASELRNQADVLTIVDGRVRGQTFQQVEGRYELHAEAAAGQRVAVRLVPELHHGELRNRYSGSDLGILLMTPSRERQVFDELTMSVELAPGEMLVISCLPESEATLGGVLHTVTSNGRSERKLIGIRVLETPPSEILADK